LNFWNGYTLLTAPAALLLDSFAVGLGLILGSFLNVVIYRLPLQMGYTEDKSKVEGSSRRINILFPRSHCTHCLKNIAIYDNLPVLSYVWLRGRCRYCKQPIPPSYPFVEGLMAGLSLLLFLKYGVSLAFLASLLLSSGLVVLSHIDFKFNIIPDPISLSLVWLGLLLSTQGVFVSSDASIMGAIMGYVSLWIINYLYRLLRSRDGLGGGDLKLMAAIGAWLGLSELYAVILTASFLGAIVGLSLMLFRRSTLQSSVPFGPFLSLSAWIQLYFFVG
jgi:leader peptidase (prepilin peptidase)/N-methyltransferase